METGTALHEAAIFGKGDVVRLLLDSGEFSRCIISSSVAPSAVHLGTNMLLVSPSGDQT